MSLAESLALGLSVLGSAALAVLATLLPARPRVRGAFSAGMALLAVQALNSFWLTTDPRPPVLHEFALRLAYALGLPLALVWGLCVVSLATPEGASARGRWLWAPRTIALASLISVGALMVGPAPFQTGSEQIRWRILSATGLSVGVAEVLLISVVLAILELCYRGASSDARWRIKFLLLGLCAIFLPRLFVMTHAILFGRLDASHLTAQAAGLPVAYVLVTLSLLRGGLADRQLRVSSSLLYRSVTLVVTGLYLIGAGVFGWVLSALEAPQAVFWAVLGLLLAGLCAAVLLLSEDLRWRFRQFVNRYLYRHKYDYRDQWVTFTRRVGAPTSLSELSDRLLETVSGTVGATRGAIYLHDDLEVNVYRRAGVLGPDPWPATLSASVGTLAQMMIPPWRPRVLQHPGERSASLVDQPELASVQPPALVIPLGWHAEPVGLILLGPQRTGLPYDAEDVELLATLAQQATGALVSLRLAEAAARAREFAAFHRFTSYVLHDLKSTVSALSLLSRNAERHLHDPEFQRDALQTLARSVDRMRALLARLAPTASLNAPPARVPVDLRAVVGQLADTVPTSDHLHLVRALDPVPPVLGDPEALQQALRSIIDNALEAMEHKGTLTLGTSWRAPWVHVSVSDTGCGMTPEFIHSSLFVPFRTTKPGGWGVGLYYAREIVAAHGGRIEVVSAQGKGTAVSLILPLAPAGGDSSSS